MRIFTYHFNQKYLSFRIFGISLHLYYGRRYIAWVNRLLKRRMQRKTKIIKNKIEKKQKIRVGFLVSEQAKWGYQSVYEAFEEDSNFEPVILATKLQLEHKGGKTYYKTMEDCVEFFKNKNMNVELAYDQKRKKYLPLKKLGVDIVFYQQPWDIDVCQHPINVSKYAITGYTSYGFELMEYTGSYMEQFHRWIDFMFTVSQKTLVHINDIAPDVSNVIAVGCTKLDSYMEAKEFLTDKPVVIYAPHHSFEEHGLNLATFQFNGLDILRLAQRYKDKFYWVFKPHPRLKHAVIINNIMSAAEIDEYYKAWTNIGEVCESGDYIELFKNSAGLITDCCSFLGEYLPSGRPVFHLINDKAKFNDAAKDFISSYYTIHDMKGLISDFERVLVQGDDYKKDERLRKIGLIFDPKEKTGQKIYRICTQLLNKRDI